jgi:hypothetical protein
MFSIVRRSPRLWRAFPPTATTSRCFFPLGGVGDDGDDEVAVVVVDAVEAAGADVDDDADIIRRAVKPIPLPLSRTIIICLCNKNIVERGALYAFLPG